MSARFHCILALAASFLIAGCHGRIDEAWPETGERRFAGHTTQADGERRATGHWTFWYPDGDTKQAQGWYDRAPLPGVEGGLKVGVGTRVPTEHRIKKWSFWDPTGTILCEGTYAEGLRTELWACWLEDGELCCTGSFEAGRPEGFHATWADGERVDEHYYVDGQLHGPRVVRDSAGQVTWQGEYERGKLVSSEPVGEAPALHVLEVCARAAEDGLRTTPADHRAP